MKSPYFIPAERSERAEPDETNEESGRDLRKILRESDDKAHKAFERRDPNRPHTFRKTHSPPPAKENSEEK
jgi:hypothetical protein